MFTHKEFPKANSYGPKGNLRTYFRDGFLHHRFEWLFRSDFIPPIVAGRDVANQCVAYLGLDNLKGTLDLGLEHGLITLSSQKSIFFVEVMERQPLAQLIADYENGK